MRRSSYSNKSITPKLQSLRLNKQPTPLLIQSGIKIVASIRNLPFLIMALLTIPILTFRTFSHTMGKVNQGKLTLQIKLSKRIFRKKDSLLPKAPNYKILQALNNGTSKTRLKRRSKNNTNSTTREGNRQEKRIYLGWALRQWQRLREKLI